MVHKIHYLIFLLLVGLCTHTNANEAELTRASCLFDAVENVYKEYFYPHQETQITPLEKGDAYVRFYPDSNVLMSYLGNAQYALYGEWYLYGTIEQAEKDIANGPCQSNEHVELVLGNIQFPDGVIGRRYSLAIEPESGIPPFQFSLSTGTLPVGLTLDKSSGLIQGEPSVRGFAEFTVQVVDGNGSIAEQPGAIKVYGVLTFGEHGSFKECNGLQMAFNSAQDLDEIRIEQGTYECNGLEIPSSKSFEHGIKVSGGWDASFENQSEAPILTVFDGGAKKIKEIENEKQCEEASGVWKRVCFQKEPQNSSILSASANGYVAIEGLFFQNGHSRDGGAIYGNGKVKITNCIFTDNTAFGNGGAVFKADIITNSTFTNNSAYSYYGGASGGAVFSVDTLTHCTFTNNNASWGGGAVSGVGTISHSNFTSNNTSSSGGAVSGGVTTTCTNSTFTNNSASEYGGAVSGVGIIISSAFTNNNASINGGAVYSHDFSTITNSTFANNSASENGGAVYSSRSSTITNSIFTNNSASINGGAVYSSFSSSFSYFSPITNSIFINNSASINGGAFYGKGTILNTIFAQNKVGEKANDITPNGDLHVNYTLVNNISGGVDLGTNIIMGDPRFVDVDNGNFHLRTDSPAINVGDSSVVTVCSEYYNCDLSCTNQCSNRYSEECKSSCCSCKTYKYPFLRDSNGNVIDLDGNPRVVGDAIDMGAYELLQ